MSMVEGGGGRAYDDDPDRQLFLMIDDSDWEGMCEGCHRRFCEFDIVLRGVYDNGYCVSECLRRRIEQEARMCGPAFGPLGEATVHPAWVLYRSRFIQDLSAPEERSWQQRFLQDVLGI